MKLEKSQMRLTYQRKIILEELKNLGNHPTVDEVYLAVKKRLPRISMSTVYRSLEVLSKNGFIKKLEPIDTQKRFDDNVGVHYHFYCLNCGKIKDAPLHESESKEIEEAIKSIEKVIEKRGYKVNGYTLEFWGKCDHCEGGESYGGEKSKK